MRMTQTGKHRNAADAKPETKAAIDAFPETDYVLQMFDISSVSESETSYFPSLPTRSIEPGETWGRQSDANVNANEAFVTQFKYVGKKQEEGRILDLRSTQKSWRTRPASRWCGNGHRQQADRAGQCLFDQKMKHFVSANYERQ